jgi:predicted DNA-binding transcriptional regulator YafY
MAGILGVMSGTPARLLALLSLLQTPREWPGRELADRLEVSMRTVRRDVERLRELGYPVQASRGSLGGYRLVAGKAMPPLLLDEEEAVAIAVGLRTAARHAVAGIEDASVRALGKLEQVLPSRLRHRVGALSTATVAMVAWSEPTVEPSTLTTLAAAAANRERLRFGYQAHDGTRTTRLAEPYRLVSAGHRWYLVAYDSDRYDWRIFRVDRISDIMPTGVRTAPRPLPFSDAAEYVLSRMYDMAPTYRAVVTLYAPLAQVAGRLGAENLEPVDERTCRLHSPADTLDYLAMRLAMLGCEFEVHSPPELAAYLRELGGRLLLGGTAVPTT